MTDHNLTITNVSIDSIHLSEFNPRTWTKEAEEQLMESLERFGFVDPIVVNNAPGREGIIIGGHFRYSIAKKMGLKEVPVVFITIADLAKERELNIRLNKNVGEFNWDMLADFDEVFLKDVGFSSEERDDIFELEDIPEEFDLEKELKKLNIENITVQKGDVYDLDGSRLCCGDSTIESDMLNLFHDGLKADMCFTDPPYILDYLHGKKKEGKAVTGFGVKRNRRYLETDEIPPDFTEKWMKNIKSISKNDFNIIVYENWKNIRTIWGEMEKFWKVKNMIVWHVPNRNQGFAGKYKLFSKHDIAMVGTSHDTVELNTDPEPDAMLEEEYKTALYAISGKPHWEGYGKDKKYCPTDFIDYKSADEKSSGQGVIFGTKPIEILIPYIKILTKRDELIVEPFGGSGSTLIASVKMNRRCFIMEKSPVYAEVILSRWSKLTGKKPVKIIEAYGK